ncbi:hypothetical protein EOM82_09430, partial [bacterium]|nr:hypothetical protein [bacterium]
MPEFKQKIADKKIWALFLLLLAALALRLYKLGSNDLWYDEVLSILIGQKFCSSWNPPLYFMFLHYWIKIFGASEFALRFPSLIFSLLSVYACFITGKRLYSFSTGILAGALMGFSSLQIWYAQEARPYSLIVLLGIASTYFFWQSLVSRKSKNFILYTLSTALLLYCDITYFSLFLIVAHALSSLILYRERFRIFAILLCAIGLLFLPQAVKFAHKLFYVKNGFWIPHACAGSLFITIENFNLGYNVWPLAYKLSLFFSVLFLSGSFLSATRNRAWAIPTAFMSILCFVPILSVFFVSKIFFPLYLDRGLMLFSPYYYVLLAFGIRYFLQAKG